MGVTGMLAAANGLRHTDPLAELLGLRIGCDSTSRDRSCRLPDRPNPRWKGEDSADLTRRQHGYRSATQIAVGPGSPDVPFSGPGRAHRRYDAHVLPHPVDRPLVFLDVDGPLIPFKARPAGEISPDTSPDGGGNPLLDRLDPEDGRRLLALGCPLIWATTWGADANEIICPRLGLPELPFVEWSDDDEPLHGLHWKTRSLARWAAGHSFVWLDDEITDATSDGWLPITPSGHFFAVSTPPSV